MTTELFKLQTPKGEVVKVRLPSGEVKMEVHWDQNLGDELSSRFNKAQQFIDSECLRHCEKFTPKDTGILIQSGIMNTTIGSGELVYRTPYARRWYYRPAAFQGAPLRGNMWFERMKQEYRKSILEGAAKLAGGNAK